MLTAVTDNQHTHTAMSKVLLKAFEDEIEADINLLVQDRTIKASKFILSANSTVFRTQLSGSWRESSEKLIRIDQFSYEVIYELVRGMYSGELNLKNIEMALELFEAAHYYQIDNLKQSALDYLLVAELHKKHIVSLLLVAELHNIPQLTNRVADYLTEHQIDVETCAGYGKIRDNLQIMSSLFKLTSQICRQQCEEIRQLKQALQTEVIQCD